MSSGCRRAGGERSVSEGIRGDDAQIVLIAVVRIEAVPPHASCRLIGVAHGRGSAISDTGLILGNFGIAGPGALMLQAHIMARLVRRRGADIPRLPAAEIVGKDKAAH